MKKQVSLTALALATVLTATAAHAGGVTVMKDGDSKLKIGGKFFLNTTQYDVTKNGATSAKSVGTAVDRAYFTAKYYFDDQWMMRITTDMYVDKNLNKKNSNIFLKYAYVEGKLAGDAAVLRLGQSHTPWIDYEQGLWKHRYVSKVLIDTQGYDASSDLGIGLKGKVADGMVAYFATLTSGAGYSHPTTQKTASQSLDFDSRVSVYPVKGLTIDLGYRNGYKNSDTYQTPANDALLLAGTNANGVTASKYKVKSTLTQIMATYGTHDYRVGFNLANNVSKQDGAANDSAKEQATALWGWAKFDSKFGAFARFENTDNKLAGVANPQNEKRTLIGAEYTPRKHVTFSLVVDNTKFTDLGDAAGATEEKKVIGLFSQVKF